jgi:hypothetical protein
MDQQQLFSNTVNRIGGTEVRFEAIWRDNILVGIRPDGGVSEKSWLRQGSIVEIDTRRWVVLDVHAASEDADSRLMMQLIAVE